MLSKSLWKAALAVSLVLPGWAGTFGKVVAIGGAASDLALDEPRGVLYIANFTANRIDVMSLANNAIQTSINVAAQPSALALSPDDRYLVVAHFGNNAAPASSANALTVIDLNSNGQQTYALGNPPLGVAFGSDGLALVVTTTDFILFDPNLGTTVELSTISGVVAKTLPQPPATFPGTIVAASVAASADHTVIYGLGDTLLFRYNVSTQQLTGGIYTATPPLGPRVVSVSSDGSYFTAGWTLKDQTFTDVSEFISPTGTLNIGSTQIDSSRNLIYAQVLTTQSVASQPILQVVDSDNLTVEQNIQLPENLAGKSALTSDGSYMYAISDSGVLVLPVGSFAQMPRVVAAQEDVVFHGDYCVRQVTSQALSIVDPGGNKTPFTISSDTPGLTVSPSSGTTPATVTVTVNPNAFAGQNGTVTAHLTIQSAQAINMPPQVRVLINSHQPNQRGTFVDVPGTLVDMLSDPTQDRFYILRQDKNQLLVFNGTNGQQIATLRTCNNPKGMAITFDRAHLLVGCDAAQYLKVFDLQTLQPEPPVRMAGGDYVQSVASSSNAILAMTRNASGGNPGVHSIDLITQTSSRLPTLGVYQNNLPLNTVLTASANGASILLASSNGATMLYDANVGSFTASRKDFGALSGSYAASSFNQFVVGNNILDASLVPSTQLAASMASASGFAFVDQFGFFTAAPGTAASGGTSSGGTGGTSSGAATGPSSGPGTIQSLSLGTSTPGMGLATPMVEAPLLGTSTQAFTRTVAPLYSRTAIINLTVSGFTVLPWNYAASVAPPQISAIVSAADGSPNIGPGGLISLYGQNLSPVNMATSQIPLPTALADSCLTVNGQPVPVLFVSAGQINAQMPFEAIGNVTMVLRTPGGISPNFNLQVLPGAPTVFLSGSAGPQTDIPTIVRNTNGELVTASDPVHHGDVLIIYLTGLGQTSPAGTTGAPAPLSPLASALNAPTLTLGGVSLPVMFAGATPAEVGVNQINVKVPNNVPSGDQVPLVISQGATSTSILLRVVN